MSDNLAAILGELEQLIASRAKMAAMIPIPSNYYPATRIPCSKKLLKRPGDGLGRQRRAAEKNDRRIGGSFFSLPCRHESL